MAKRSGKRKSTKSKICPEEIDGSFIPIRNVSVTSVELDGEGVLLDEATGSLYFLNRIGHIVWSCMDGSGTIDDLAADLSAAFSTAFEQVRGDVVALARELGL